MSGEPPDELTPAERRVSEYLQALGREGSAAAPSVTATVIGTARWQRVLRTPLQTVGTLAAAVADGVRMVLGVRGRERHGR